MCLTKCYRAVKCTPYLRWESPLLICIWPYSTISKPPTQTQKLKTLQKLILSYFHNIIHITSQLSEPDLVKLAVAESAKLLPYIVGSRKAVKQYLKVTFSLNLRKFQGPCSWSKFESDDVGLMVDRRWQRSDCCFFSYSQIGNCNRRIYIRYGSKGKFWRISCYMHDIWCYSISLPTSLLSVQRSRRTHIACRWSTWWKIQLLRFSVLILKQHTSTRSGSFVSWLFIWGMAWKWKLRFVDILDVRNIFLILDTVCRNRTSRSIIGSMCIVLTSG